MKRRVKIALGFLKECFDTLVSLVLILAFSRRVPSKSDAKRIEKIIILGNGPSLRNDLDAVVKRSGDKTTDICAVNDFAFSDVFSDVRPSIYVLADPNYWMEGASAELNARRLLLLNIFSEKVTWPMDVMLPVEAKECPLFNGLASDFVTYSFYNRTPVSGFNWFRFRFFDYGLGMPPPFNVLIAAITLAIAKDYKKIFILGADHSWHEELTVANEKDVLVAQKHFYDNAVDRKPVYKEGSETFTVGELFIRWGKVFKIYEILALYASYKNAEVYNLSRKTYIDAFPRSNIEEFDNL
ncbi:UNVERIFIED_CONTAM: hypothetical protein MKS84_08870 [Pseudomonas sp. JL1]